MTEAIVHPLKRCTKCGREFPPTLEYFYRNKAVKSGLVAQCKTCANERHSRWEKANWEHVKAWAREWNKKNPEKVKAVIKKYRANNREKVRALNSKWSREHPEYYRSRQKEHAHVQKAVVLRRRATKKSLPAKFTHKDWKRALDHFNGCCAVCGRQLNDLFGTHTAAADHWIPLSSPDCPGTIVTNMVPLCHGIGGCNNTKSNKNPSDWLVSKYGKSKAKQILARIEAYFEWVKSQS